MIESSVRYGTLLLFCMAALPAMAQESGKAAKTGDGKIIVTRENFTVAETDKLSGGQKVH
ncbi:MAG: hypothetical protein WAL90_18080 [Desulfobacterales bacterium]